MKLFNVWKWMLPTKFYGGGGGGSQTPQINPEEQQLAAVSQEKWNEYKNTYVPLENEWIAKVDKLNNNSYHNDAGAMASNEVKIQHGAQTGKLTESMAGQRFGSADYLNQANDITQARNKASMGVTDRYLKGKQDVIAIGQGQSTSALEGMNDVANTAVDAQIKTSQNKFKANEANQGMYGILAGSAVAATTNKANQTNYQTNYQTGARK